MWVPFLASLPTFAPAFKTCYCECPRDPVTFPSPPLDAALHPPKTTTAPDSQSGGDRGDVVSWPRFPEGEWRPGGLPGLVDIMVTILTPTVTTG